jgi:mannose-6-phosphate isomerase
MTKNKEIRTMNPFYPLCFSPVYKDYLWGGDRIPKLFGRDMPKGIYAESWEISTHPDGTTAIANGPLAGKTLTDLLPEHKTALLGTKIKGPDFPLLIKLIDARENLSVQVHPNDANANAVHGDPKTEMWYFLEGDGSAKIYCGLKSGIGKKEFLKALEDKTFADILQVIPVRKGEGAFVPGGRVHAIGAGCLILEIQQNSNTTYRIYDWDRVGDDGRARELHIDKALQVIAWEDHEDPRCTPQRFTEDGVEGMEIEKSAYFRLVRFNLDSAAVFKLSGESFHALFTAEGSGTVTWPDGEEELRSGQSWLIPAAMDSYTVIPADSGLTLLRTTVP